MKSGEREGHCLLGSGKGRERLQRQTRASLAVLGEDNRPNTAQGQAFTTWRALLAEDHEHAKQDTNYLLCFRNAFLRCSRHTMLGGYALMETVENACNQTICLQQPVQ